MHFRIVITVYALVLAGCSRQSSAPSVPPREEPISPVTAKMILQLYPPPTNEPETITDAADAKTVETTIRSQPWNDITFVVLRIDDANWFEVSGSLNPADGLSAAYSENGMERVSDGAPASLDVCVSLMLSYLRRDEEWRSAIEWK